MAKSFRELRVWNRAIELTETVYAITADFPRAEAYGLTSQMRRAAVSVASNIAEGSARGSRKDFRQFVLIARGSNCELQTQLLLATRLKFASAERVRDAEVIADEIGQMLSGLSKYLSRPAPPKTTPLRTDN